MSTDLVDLYQITPARAEAAGRFSRRIELALARGAYETCARILTDARQQLEQPAGAAAPLDTPLAEICQTAGDGGGGGASGEGLLRVLNALEAGLDVLTLGDYLACDYEALLGVPSVGPRGRDALHLAVIRWFVAASQAS